MNTEYGCEVAHLFHENERKSSFTFNQVLFRQSWIFTSVLLHTIISGCVAGYSAVLLPQLEAEERDLTTDQQSWIASMAILPMLCGCVISAWSIDYFGRLETLNISLVLAFIGWLIIFASDSFETLLIGRLISGLSVGYSSAASTCYLSEISSPKYRGFFLSGFSLGVSAGQLIIHVLGTFLYWRNVALCTCIMPMIVFTINYQLPESHVWLYNKGYYEASNAAFKWYSGNALINASVLKPQAQEKHSIEWRTLLKKQFLKPLMIMNIFFLVSQLSGNNAIVFYSISITQNTMPSLNKYASMITVDVIRLLASIAACFLTHKFKVRILTFISAAGIITSLYCIALFTYLGTLYSRNGIFTTIPLVFLITYIVFISIGITPLSWSISGELLPANRKGISGGIATAVNFLTSFLIVKTAPELFNTLSIAGAFAIYGTLTLLFTLILCIILPETKNKTLVEIQKEFK